MFLVAWVGKSVRSDAGWGAGGVARGRIGAIVLRVGVVG